MLFDQNRVDAIIHNWKNQVFSNETIQGVPQRHSTCLKPPIGGFRNLASRSNGDIILCCHLLSIYYINVQTLSGLVYQHTEQTGTRGGCAAVFSWRFPSSLMDTLFRVRELPSSSLNPLLVEIMVKVEASFNNIFNNLKAFHSESINEASYTT